MRAWENIINTAMLGTDKPMPVNVGFPEELIKLAEQVDAIDDLDKESKFLHKAALVYNYRQCGFTPLKKLELPVSSALSEIKPLCSEEAAYVLKAILDDDNLALLEFWLTKCNDCAQLLPPEVLPVVLDKLYQYPSLRPLVVACSGNRGIWLSQFNPQWDYFVQLPDGELWQTGKPEERIKLLQKIRQAEPEKAREWLQQTWEQENAASKAELLKVLRINSSTADLPWLESLQAEKGQKVKDEVLALLKQIPGSSIIRKYEEVLSTAVALKKEKALFGMVNKTSIQVQLPAQIDESIYKSGIEKLAGQKSTISDNEFVIYQLISFVPPAFWETHFEANPGQVVEYFEKYAPSLIPALGLAVVRFQATAWISHFLHREEFYVDFVELLYIADREKYLLSFLDKDPRSTTHYSLAEIEKCGLSVTLSDAGRANNKSVIYHASNQNDEWGLTFATSIVKHMADNLYQYFRGFYKQNIKLIPVELLSQLEKINSKEPNLQSNWGKTREELAKLLTLKQQTLQAFKEQ